MLNMNNYIKNDTQNDLLQLLYKEFKRDHTVDSWHLVNSPWPVCIILTAYLTFVLKLGPKLMETRKPYNIKNIMIVYNFMQAAFNSYIITYVLTTPEAFNYFWNYSCHPDNTGSSNHITLEFHKASWFFAVSKIFDLLDTIFFIMRKKQSHVSFLHVYHHVNMVITCFFHLRFIKTINAAMVGLVVNSSVHVAMYSYYFLSTFGPNMQKFLWWKKYLTRLQIIQFIFGISYMIGLLSFKCSCPKLFIYYMLADVALFLYLFIKFYKNTYKGKDKIQ